MTKMLTLFCQHFLHFLRFFLVKNCHIALEMPFLAKFIDSLLLHGVHTVALQQQRLSACARAFRLSVSLPGDEPAAYFCSLLSNL